MKDGRGSALVQYGVVTGLVLIVALVAVVQVGSTASGRLLEPVSQRRSVETATRAHATVANMPVETGPTASDVLGTADRVLTRLLWSVPMLAPVAIVHAASTGQWERYLGFQVALWRGVVGAAGDTIVFVQNVPTLAATVKESPEMLPGMLAALGASLVTETLRSVEVFAMGSDEEAATIAGSFVFDSLLGHTTAAVGGGSALALKSKRVATLARKLPLQAIAHKLTPPFCTGPRCKPAFAGWCFVAGTPVHTGHGTTAIEKVQLGARVAATNATMPTVTAVTAAWKRIDVELDDARSADGVVRVALLRDPQWLEATGAAPGEVIDIALEEMGIHGRARVLHITDAPRIDAGPGHVVLATIESESTEVLRLRLAETGEPLELTARHRLYSLDRASFIAARDLRIGETLRTRTGARTVASIERIEGAHRVYNLEGETAHSYFVAKSAVLSHNDQVNGCAAPLPKHDRAPDVPENIWSSAERALTVSHYRNVAAEIVDASGLDHSAFAREAGLSRATVWQYSGAPSLDTLPTVRTLLAFARMGGMSIDSMLLRGAPRWHVNIGLLEPSARRSVIQSAASMRREAASALRAAEATAAQIYKERFAALVLRSGMTDAAFAERIGRHTNTIGFYISPKFGTLPRSETLVVLAKLEGDPRIIDWLVGLSNQRPAGITDEIMERAAQQVSLTRGPSEPRARTPRPPSTRELGHELSGTYRERATEVFSQSGLDRPQLAEIMGADVSTVSRLLSGRAPLLPTAEHAVATADHLRISIDYMFKRSDKRELPAVPVSSAPIVPSTPHARTRAIREAFRTGLAAGLERTGLTVKELARRIGVNRRTLLGYLSPNGTHPPRLDVVYRAADELGESMDKLLGVAITAE